MGRTRYTRGADPRIAYELRGVLHRRRPWLVLIQGLGFDRSGWAPVTRRLRRRFRLLLVDNRGSGRSDLPDRSLSVADLSDDVVRVLDAARVRKAHIVGTSLGGMVAQELAIERPERVDRLVLACTTPGWPYAYPMPAGAVQLMAATAPCRGRWRCDSTSRMRQAPPPPTRLAGQPAVGCGPVAAASQAEGVLGLGGLVRLLAAIRVALVAALTALVLAIAAHGGYRRRGCGPCGRGRTRSRPRPHPRAGRLSVARTGLPHRDTASTGNAALVDLGLTPATATG